MSIRRRNLLLRKKAERIINTIVALIFTIFAAIIAGMGGIAIYLIVNRP